MPYCTKQDLVDRFGETEIVRLSDRSNQGIADDVVITQAISDASAEVDGYLAGRYALPLAVVPVSLVRVAAELARYNLYSDVSPENVRSRHSDALKFLKAVGTGDLSLGLDGNGAQPTSVGTAQIVSSSEKLFSRDKGGIV